MFWDIVNVFKKYDDGGLPKQYFFSIYKSYDIDNFWTWYNDCTCCDTTLISFEFNNCQNKKCVIKIKAKIRLYKILQRKYDDFGNHYCFNAFR